MVQKDIPELLAPAGSMAALQAAVNAGADAVYLAGMNFSARQFASNFTLPDIEKALQYAHLQGVKVYVTVNTLIKDSELSDVADYLFWLYETGADAVIIQDLGVASLCKELVPDLEMHASTQMNIHNLAGVLWARDFGFKRVILAREMSYSEVTDLVRKKNRIELEIFVHGALCYSYSGQCLISSLIGGRSGNRGRCAQSCRKPYQLMEGKIDSYGRPYELVIHPRDDEYLLSTRDLSLYPVLNKILDLKVDSVKIEGRMRSPEYVATVVEIYRKTLDNARYKNWEEDVEEVIRLKLAFNRGFTQGYLLKNDENTVRDGESPGNRGLYLGRVLNSHKKGYNTIIQLEQDYILKKGDGIVFIAPNKEKYGMQVDQVPGLAGGKIYLPTPKRVPTGSRVYLTRCRSLLKEATKIIQDKPKSIPLDLEISWDKESRINLKADFTDLQGNPNKLCVKTDLIMDNAIKKPLSRKQILKQLSKTGDTPFIIRKIEAEYPGGLFTPLSKLNQIRRDFLKNAETLILENLKPPKIQIESSETRLIKIKQNLKSGGEYKKTERPPLELAIYASSLPVVEGALKKNCGRIYFQPFLWEEYSRENPCNRIGWEEFYPKMLEVIFKAQNLCCKHKAELVWKWPSINKDPYLKHCLPLIPPLYEGGINKIMVENLGAARAIKHAHPEVELYGSTGLNLWNHLTINTLLPTFKGITLSNELKKEDMAMVVAKARCGGSEPLLEYVVEGNLESLISEDCLLSSFNLPSESSFYGILDGKKRLFPLIIDDEARTHILNSVELCLIDHIPLLYKLGVDRLIIDSRNRTPDYVGEIVTIYTKGLQELEKNDPDITIKLNQLKNRIKKISLGGITTGTFIKGLKE